MAARRQPYFKIKTIFIKYERLKMRVIAGSAKHLQLKSVEGLDTRPTTDRIKETLFNMLQNDIYDCQFLDLFSGSGAIAIEALSRGGKYAYLVENSNSALGCIKDNLNFTKLSDKATVMKEDVLTAIGILEGRHIKFDIIFMDPPYNKEIEKQVLKRLEQSSIVHSDTIIIVEASLKTDFLYLNDMKYDIIKEKKYKTNKHIFLCKQERQK